MEKVDFIQAKQFIYSDIERELTLARAMDNRQNKVELENIGVSGGGNFLAALGLLCYTEFAGKLKCNMKKKNGDDYAAGNFNAFFDSLGEQYKQFRESGVNVYNVFRCGLAHEYYVKKDCTIYMFGNNEKQGIGIDENGKYYFVVDLYFKDFQAAFDEFEKERYGKK